MWDELEFAFALSVSGLSIGLMYSLIALGFVLVYKATEAINFAQGEFVMLAGFIVALILAVKGAPVIVAVGAVLALMILFSFGLERIVLRPLLGRPSKGLRTIRSSPKLNSIMSASTAPTATITG